MPVYVFSFHTKQSWMPDNPRGYVERNKGIQRPNAKRADDYRRVAKHPPFMLTDALQRAVIEEVFVACEHQNLHVHFVATEPTHIHVLVSWRTDKHWQAVRNGLKGSLAKRFRRLHGTGPNERQYFSNGSSRKQIRDQRHFDHWMTQYGPKHSGWKWCEARGRFK